MACANHRTVAVIEDILKPTAEAMRGVSTLDLARLRGVIEVDLYRAGVAITRVHAATLKAFARSGQSTKADMVQAARDNLPPSIQVRNDNEADAFWLMAMTMAHYGVPVVKHTPRRKTFGDKPEWAYWRWPEDMDATVIAIDPSLTATGLCVWRLSQPLHIETIHSQGWESYHGWSAPQRHARISEHIMSFVDNRPAPLEVSTNA